MKAVPSFPRTSAILVAFTNMRDAVVCKWQSRAAAPLRLAFGISILGAVHVQAADPITTSDIIAIPANAAPSGNGTIENRMFTFSGSEIQNSAGLLFNGDNGNNGLTQGGGADTQFFDESFVTTAGELKAFYNLNFLPGSIYEIVLFLDLNETGGGVPINTLGKLDIILNPTSIQGNPNPLGDVSSISQAAINQVYTGGSLLASLNPQPAVNLPVNSQGAGFADYAIFTGINPFTLNDSDVLLFNISMSELNNGAEEIYLSGSYAASDIIIPEPGCLALVITGGLALAAFRRRNR